MKVFWTVHVMTLTRQSWEKKEALQLYKKIINNKKKTLVTDPTPWWPEVIDSQDIGHY